MKKIKLILLLSILPIYCFSDNAYCVTNQNSAQELFNDWAESAGYKFNFVNKDYYYNSLNQNNLDRERVYDKVSYSIDKSICSNDIYQAINNELIYLRASYPNDYFVINYYESQKIINLEVGNKNRFN